MIGKICLHVVLWLNLAVASSSLFAREDNHSSNPSSSGYDFEPVANATYRFECGACHFAYPPGLLPARSWRRVMNNLETHFGESAELPQKTKESLLTYLVNHSADKTMIKKSKKIMRSMRSSYTPERITKVPYIRNRHFEIPLPMYRDNPDIRSLGNCDACHTRAEEGSFASQEIDVPGFGR